MLYPFWGPRGPSSSAVRRRVRHVPLQFRPPGLRLPCTAVAYHRSLNRAGVAFNRTRTRPPLPGGNVAITGPKTALLRSLPFQTIQLGVGRILPIHPGVTLANHLGVDVQAVHIDAPDEASVAVLSDFDDSGLLAERQLAQILLGSLPIGLSPLRRVNLGQPDLDSSLVDKNRQRVAVGNRNHLPNVRAARERNCRCDKGANE